MKKIFGWIVMIVLVFCTIPVFAGTDEVVHNGGADKIIGAGFEEVGEYKRTVEFHEGSELRGSEVDAFQNAFFQIKERLPEKSFFEITRFPEVSRYHVRFSDGHIYVAVGSGPTVEEAFNNLVANFK